MQMKDPNGGFWFEPLSLVLTNFKKRGVVCGEDEQKRSESLSRRITVRQETSFCLPRVKLAGKMGTQADTAGSGRGARYPASLMNFVSRSPPVSSSVCWHGHACCDFILGAPYRFLLAAGIIHHWRTTLTNAGNFVNLGFPRSVSSFVK